MSPTMMKTILTVLAGTSGATAAVPGLPFVAQIGLTALATFFAMWAHGPNRPGTP